MLTASYFLLPASRSFSSLCVVKEKMLSCIRGRRNGRKYNIGLIRGVAKYSVLRTED